MSRLAGKVAVVTGASKGIGAAIAKALAADGAKVVVNYATSKSGADAVVQAITEAGGEALATQGDVSQSADAKRLVETAIATYGKLDILINNSGVYEFGALDEVTETQFRRMFDINVLGLLLMTQAASAQLPSTQPPRAPWTQSPACSRKNSARARSASTPSTRA
jgi:3-oxoacyl-[acyl-carrier protein] reductase